MASIQLCPKRLVSRAHKLTGNRAYCHRRTGRGAGGGSCPPPILAVCRHEFGQRVDIIRAKHNTCLNNTNLGSVTAVNGKKNEFRVCYWSYLKKILAPHRIWIPENFCYYPPPPPNPMPTAAVGHEYNYCRPYHRD